jgi:NHLM bacteriocin system ABC transporter peptidase/ATP-binding protein
MIFSKIKRAITPTVIQMEAVECGAAALSIILQYYGRYIPLEKLRLDCGVSRDGSKASNILKVARDHGLAAKGYKKENISELQELDLPIVVFWNFNHFLVVEGFKKGWVYLNDPATGPRKVSIKEFDDSFTGVVLTFKPTPAFTKSGKKRSMVSAILKRLKDIKLGISFVVMVGLVLVIPGLVVPAFLRIFVDKVLVSDLTNWFLPLLWGMALVMVIQGILNWVQQYYLLKLETKIAITSSSKFLWHILRLPIEFFNQRYGGEIGARVALNEKIATLMSGHLARTVISLIMIVFFASLMFFYDVVLTLIGISAVVLNLLALRLISKKRKDQSIAVSQENSKLMGTSLSGLQAIETLKATGGEGEFFARWTGYQAKMLNSNQKLAELTDILTCIPDLLTTLTTIAILAVGGIRVMEGHLSIGMLVAFQSLMLSLLKPATDLVNLGDVLQRLEGDMNRIDDVIKNPADARVPANFIEDTQDIKSPKLSGLIEIKNLTFGYSHHEPPLIEDLSITIQPGARIALVGGSGSGKSTIAKLVSGLYQPWAGQVLFDGKEFNQVPRAVFANSLTNVDQNIFLFEGTIHDNLTLWDKSIPQITVIEAAKDACVHDIVAARPGGYDSKIQEGGINFSGGQQQLLEIARSLAINPTIMVLDEASSALDAETEKKVDDNLRKRKCSCLLVAHRLSTIRDCDEIIVLDNGKVVERGTHDELYELKGLYKELLDN